MLLDDIIELSTDSKQSVTGLLRKCLILGNKLGNARLRDWANQELNGYISEDDLPEYRIVPAAAKGYMTGPFGSGIKNFPIPPALLDKEHVRYATKVYLTASVSEYEELLRSKSDGFKLEWSANLTLYYQDRIETQNGCCLAHAWQQVGRSAFVRVLEAVRNRTLNLALDIQASVGQTDKELERITPESAAMVEKTVNNYIYGGTNVLASGQSHISGNIQQTQNTINTGQRDQLDSALRMLGLSQTDIDQLSVAIKTDHPQKMGSRVMEWIKHSAPSVAVGGVKLVATLGQNILVEYLKMYYGIK
jgi:AbiTii